MISTQTEHPPRQSHKDMPLQPVYTLTHISTKVHSDITVRKISVNFYRILCWLAISLTRNPLMSHDTLTGHSSSSCRYPLVVKQLVGLSLPVQFNFLSRLFY
jgi:hypothetical protein